MRTLAREGRMTVTIGRRELLAALGGAATAWPLAAPPAGDAGDWISGSVTSDGGAALLILRRETHD